MKHVIFSNHWQKFKLIYLLLLMEVIMLVCYGVGFQFPHKVDKASLDEMSENEINQKYDLFVHVHILAFFGFGMLYSYLHLHQWSSIMFNAFLGAVAFEFTILSLGFWKLLFSGEAWHKIELNVDWLLEGDFGAVSVLIAFGGVLGKLNLTQLFIMTIIQVIFYSLNTTIGSSIFHALDMGGSIYIHLFGGLFGLAVSLGMKQKNMDTTQNRTSYISNTTAAIGTVFLFIVFPSFNGALAVGDQKLRILVGSVFSITSSLIATVLLTPFFHSGKLNMEKILNASIAGGVVVGCNADVLGDVWVHLLVGFAAGALACVGFSFVSPNLHKKFGIHDTAGITNLHVMPGLLASIISIIVAGTQDWNFYHETLMNIYTPFQVPFTRGSAVQAGMQTAVVFITMGIAIVTGLLTGLLFRLNWFSAPKELFSDYEYWEIENEEENKRTPSKCEINQIELQLVSENAKNTESLDSDKLSLKK